MPNRECESLAVQEVAWQSGRAPRFVLAHQSVAIEHVAGEIKRIARRNIGHVKFAQPRRDGIDREPRAPPRTLRVAQTNLALQLYQRRVDLVLHERRAGGG